jgi:hypothetical protein
MQPRAGPRRAPRSALSGRSLRVCSTLDTPKPARPMALPPSFCTAGPTTFIASPRSGRCWHRIEKAILAGFDWGATSPQEAPQAFARAVIDAGAC